LKSDYDLKCILYSEGTMYLKMDYDLKNTLNSKRTEKKREKWLRNASRRKRERRERVLDNSIKKFGVFLN